MELFKDFRKRDILVLPRKLDVSLLEKHARREIRHLEENNRVIRLDFIYTPAVVKSR